MRIRKRFPFSSMASSVSDPQLNNSTLVQQTSSQLHPIQNMGMQHNPNSDSQPSDPPVSSDQKPIIINNTLHQINQQEEASREQQEENGSNNNNTRKEYNFLAVGQTGVVPPLGSHQVDRRWFDEKVPLKRKGQETMLMLEEEEKKMKPKMKSKANKKCTSTSGMQQSHSEQGKVGTDDSSSTPNNNSVKKMNKRGGALMEGSRCSRVNGRGWRCCQQTLVGYSLCEHHLGKGRLRSISNVKARTKAPTVVATTIAPQVDTTNTTTNDIPTNDNLSSKNVLVSSSVVQPPVGDRKDTMLLDGSCYDDDDDEEDEDENEDEDDDDYNGEETNKAVVVKKKRMKLGMVKARSLSSLLNQTN
ncbi:Growth-regulating factor [Heracleum sosnowskyi]|uniref:Growth-regulating factor n=1 Tax=Heracleum sosnowskyi TaxID=360622 RepID=A0AAD8N5M9_9APIA|nr:Growth-regulating factor [Heracleum sosnowskyi]